LYVTCCTSLIKSFVIPCSSLASGHSHSTCSRHVTQGRGSSLDPRRAPPNKACICTQGRYAVLVDPFFLFLEHVVFSANALQRLMTPRHHSLSPIDQFTSTQELSEGDCNAI